MLYNNLIYLLIVILILSVRATPTEPQLPLAAALAIFLAKGLFYQQLAHRLFRRSPPASASRYFSAEQKLTILAILSLALDIFLLDGQYYLARLPLAKTLPVLTSLGGLGLYFAYLAILWAEARPSYQLIFGRRHSLGSFLSANLKLNVAIILPWLLLSLASDLLQRSQLPLVKEILASPWGEPTILLLFFLILILIFPSLVTRLWNCTPLPAGPLRQRIVAFCRRQRVRCREIMLWPLFEGRLLTAGVMGITARFRYLLITPALIESMEPEEIEAVVAHEVGHVKRYHLQLYLVLFLGFGLVAQLGSYPFLYLTLTSDLFYWLVQRTGSSPVTALTAASTTSLLLLMILYFRFLFGFFMRNFERQADLYALTAIGDARPLIMVFEKIALLSGNIRDLPSWHHFGLGQRIDFLVRCQQNPGLIRRHNRKIALALVLYLLTMLLAGIMLWKLPPNLLEGAPKAKFAESLLREKIATEPENPVWYHLLGDLHYSRGQHRQALAAYQQALELEPENPELLNNLAWLRLTAPDPALLDPERALALALAAARRKPSGHVLDTLATAYWANGMLAEAVATEQRAMKRDPANASYYQQQIRLFRSATWPKGLSP